VSVSGTPASSAALSVRLTAILAIFAIQKQQVEREEHTFRACETAGH
jgi:hypothetical protein